MKPLVCSLCGILLAIGAADADGRPNILLIVSDDLTTHVSPAGYDPIITPNMERLAAEGMTFHRAYCQYPVCGPSRASFLSGLYPESTGVLDNEKDFRVTRPGTLTMPGFFRRNGYWTASVGKVFHSPKHEPGAEVWDEFIRFQNDELPVVREAREKFEAEFGSVGEAKNRQHWKAVEQDAKRPLDAQTPPGHGRSGLADEQHKDGKNARQVASWLTQEAHGDKPFFIACGIQKPHVPFLAPDKYFDLYPLESIFFPTLLVLALTVPLQAAAKEPTEVVPQPIPGARPRKVVFILFGLYDHHRIHR